MNARLPYCLIDYLVFCFKISKFSLYIKRASFKNHTFGKPVHIPSYLVNTMKVFCLIAFLASVSCAFAGVQRK